MSYASHMSAEVMRRRAEFIAEHRWGLAFFVATMATFVVLPLRPPDASLAYDLLPALALGAVWIGAGVVLRLVARHWLARASADHLPVARIA